MEGRDKGLVFEGEISVPYRWTTGSTVARFLEGLRDEKRLYGLRCSGCGRVYIPPLKVCGRCSKEMEEWVPLPDEGVVVSFTEVKIPLPFTMAEPPFTLGLIRLDGADTDLLHYIDFREGEPGCGRRVKAIWKGEREGAVTDIECFVPVEKAGGGLIDGAKGAGERIVEKKGKVTVPYRWSYGKALTRFFEETSKNKRIMGAKCTSCNAVLVPPVSICGRCFRETEKEWIPLSDKGILQTFTTVYLPFPGQPTEPPYTYGLIKLDGADTLFSHLIKEVPSERIHCGMRVEAVWNEERKGDLFDIKYFRPEEEDRG